MKLFQRTVTVFCSVGLMFLFIKMYEERLQGYSFVEKEIAKQKAMMQSIKNYIDSMSKNSTQQQKKNKIYRLHPS